MEASLFSAPTLPWTMFEYMAVTKAGGCMDAANCIHGESGQRIHLRSAPNARFSTGKVSHTSSLVDQISGVREPQSPEESSVSGIQQPFAQPYPPPRMDNHRAPRSQFQHDSSRQNNDSQSFSPRTEPAHMVTLEEPELVMLATDDVLKLFEIK